MGEIVAGPCPFFGSLGEALITSGGCTGTP